MWFCFFQKWFKHFNILFPSIRSPIDQSFPKCFKHFIICRHTNNFFCSNRFSHFVFLKIKYYKYIQSSFFVKFLMRLVSMKKNFADESRVRFFASREKNLVPQAYIWIIGKSIYNGVYNPFYALRFVSFLSASREKNLVPQAYFKIIRYCCQYSL